MIIADYIFIIILKHLGNRRCVGYGKDLNIKMVKPPIQNILRVPLLNMTYLKVNFQLQPYDVFLLSQLLKKF